MIDVILSIAHGRNADQAIEGLFNEYTLSLMWSTFLHRELLRRGIDSEVINMPLFTDKKNHINKRNPKMCIEIHFNSFYDTSVRGAETLYNPGSVLGEKYAGIVQSYIKHLPNRDRGIKEGWYKQDGKTPLYFLHYTRCPALIIEPGFISAQEELIKVAPLGVEFIAQAIDEILIKSKVMI